MSQYFSFSDNFADILGEKPVPHFTEMFLGKAPFFYYYPLPFILFALFASIRRRLTSEEAVFVGSFAAFMIILATVLFFYAAVPPSFTAFGAVHQ